MTLEILSAVVNAENFNPSGDYSKSDIDSSAESNYSQSWPEVISLDTYLRIISKIVAKTR
ncbi:hypothetical protein [uncultured Mobiluncus sp.]|uniref:hypothetical protein n=1 Tax=uncultured Mobiluncus sp. TaxID=293425 RepID=UPI00262EA645|nr:hypothetical protein [uncultured Mobiluncus sp.]